MLFSGPFHLSCRELVFPTVFSPLSLLYTSALRPCRTMTTIPTNKAVIETKHPDIEESKSQGSPRAEAGVVSGLNETASILTALPLCHTRTSPAYSTARQIALVICVSGVAFLNT